MNLIGKTPGFVEVSLSKRNLDGLLDQFKEDGEGLISRCVESGEWLVVRVETDEEHYGERAPGFSSRRQREAG